MSGYRIEVMSSEWGGVATDRRWVPAMAGALNQTGEDDDAASTVESIREAEELVCMVIDQCPDDVRLVKVATGRIWPLAWHPTDMDGGDGDGSVRRNWRICLSLAVLTVRWNAGEDEVKRDLGEWLSCGEWGHDDGPDLVTSCGGMARLGFARPAATSPAVDVSIWVRRSSGEWGVE